MNNEKQLTYDQRYAVLELTDKLYEFAEQFNLPDEWVREMSEEASLQAYKATGLNTDQA